MLNEPWPNAILSKRQLQRRIRVIVRSDEGETSALWLISVSGKPVGREVLDMVAQPVEITGEVKREGDQLYLRAEPSTYRRL